MNEGFRGINNNLGELKTKTAQIQEKVGPGDAGSGVSIPKKNNIAAAKAEEAKNSIPNGTMMYIEDQDSVNVLTKVGWDSIAMTHTVANGGPTRDPPIPNGAILVNDDGRISDDSHIYIQQTQDGTRIPNTSLVLDSRNENTNIPLAGLLFKKATGPAGPETSVGIEGSIIYGDPNGCGGDDFYGWTGADGPWKSLTRKPCCPTVGGSSTSCSNILSTPIAKSLNTGENIVFTWGQMVDFECTDHGYKYFGQPGVISMTTNIKYDGYSPLPYDIVTIEVKVNNIVKFKRKYGFDMQQCIRDEFLLDLDCEDIVKLSLLDLHNSNFKTILIEANSFITLQNLGQFKEQRDFKIDDCAKCDDGNED